MVTFARVALAVVALSAVTVAQQKPNFSGRWVVVSPEKGAGQEQIVKHDQKSLSTEHASEGGGHRMIYQLDGIERRNAIPSHGSEITMMSKAAWDADRIVITTHTSYPNGMKTQSKEIWSLDPKGRLVIDYTETGPTGPGPMMKVIYVKKP
jgi:hypothetical protein